MNDDYAAAEKKTAALMEDWKQGLILRDLGDTAMVNMEFLDVENMTQEWNLEKIEAAGGAEAWGKSSEAEQSLRSLATIRAMVNHWERRLSMTSRSRRAKVL